MARTFAILAKLESALTFVLIVFVTSTTAAKLPTGALWVPTNVETIAAYVGTTINIDLKIHLDLAIAIEELRLKVAI